MATSTRSSISLSSYADHVNPQWVRLLNLLDMNVVYERCVGTELFTVDGRRVSIFFPAIVYIILATIIRESSPHCRTNWNAAVPLCCRAMFRNWRGS